MTGGSKGFPPVAVPLLRCPVCGEDLSLGERSMHCLSGHSYDVARQGYVNLLPGNARPGTADTAEMVAAREAFLAAGHFLGLREFVCRAAVDDAAAGGGRAADMTAGGATAGSGCIMEIGAGTGYYLAGVLDRLPGQEGLALDISKYAARRAARAHERIAAVVCDAWRALPVADACVSLLLDVFAPRNPSEFARVLRPDGVLLVVTPSPRHLCELVTGLGLVTVDARKPERLERAFGEGFVLDRRCNYEERLRLSPEEAATLVAMGPTARHLTPAEIGARLQAVGPHIETTLSVTVSLYPKRRP
jgi:23S rRNA (guanine745-N1)-methyltransferase